MQPKTIFFLIDSFLLKSCFDSSSLCLHAVITHRHRYKVKWMYESKLIKHYHIDHIGWKKTLKNQLVRIPMRVRLKLLFFHHLRAFDHFACTQTLANNLGALGKRVLILKDNNSLPIWIDLFQYYNYNRITVELSVSIHLQHNRYIFFFPLVIVV